MPGYCCNILSLLTKSKLSMCHLRNFKTQMQLHYSTATGSRIVICIDFKLISINKVNMRVPFPGVVDLRDRDQFNGLTLQNKKCTCLLHNRNGQFLAILCAGVQMENLTKNN